jgi:hypothetical protein
MPMKKLLHLFFLLPIFLVSCSTQRIAVLKPDVQEQYVDREGFTTQKSDSLDVTFGYLFSTKDHLVFEVSVKNNGSDSVSVSPQDFHFQSVSLLDSNQLSSPLYAQSFIQITQKLDERARERNIKAAIAIIAVVATVVAVDAATNSNSSTRHTNYKDYTFSINTGIDLSYNFFDAMIYNNLSKKEAITGLERHFMFPRKIGKSEYHLGAVYFPRYDTATKLLFNFKAGGQDFKTLFKQTIVVK